MRLLIFWIWICSVRGVREVSVRGDSSKFSALLDKGTSSRHCKIFQQCQQLDWHLVVDSRFRRLHCRFLLGPILDFYNFFSYLSHGMYIYIHTYITTVVAVLYIHDNRLSFVFVFLLGNDPVNSSSFNSIFKATIVQSRYQRGRLRGSLTSPNWHLLFSFVHNCTR